MSSMLQEMQKLEQDTKIDLWEIDLRSVGGNEVVRFSNYVNDLAELDSVTTGTIPVNVGKNLFQNTLFDGQSGWSSETWGDTNVWTDINHINQTAGYTYRLSESPAIIFRDIRSTEASEIKFNNYPPVELEDNPTHVHASAIVAGWNLSQGVKVVFEFTDSNSNIVAHQVVKSVVSSFPTAGNRVPSANNYASASDFQEIYAIAELPDSPPRARFVRVFYVFNFAESAGKDKYGLIARPQLCNLGHSHLPETHKHYIPFQFPENSESSRFSIVWQGKKYTPYPIRGSGFERSEMARTSQPKLEVANISGFVTKATMLYKNLVGARVVRHQTYKKFLDSANFPNGNLNENSLEEVRSVFEISRVSNLTRESCTFELSTPVHADNAVVPARIMLASACCWNYRGDGCGYTGRAVATESDAKTNLMADDKCSKTIQGCRARFGATAVLPFGGFAASDKFR